MKSPYQTAIACVRARTSDTASIARHTGIHECVIYALWIRERDREHRRTRPATLQTLEPELIR